MGLILILLLSTAPAPPTYRCAFTKNEPKIDGVIDDEAWKDAAWTSEFVDVASGEKAALRTHVKMLWDDRCLYLAAEMEEPDVRGELRERDAQLYLENAFEVFLDPNDDGKNYAEIEINALNTVMDLVMDKPYVQHGHANLAWTAEGLRTAVKVNGTINDASDRDAGWTVEMAIPWSAVTKLGPDSVPPKEGIKWRVELARVQAKGEGKKAEHWAWSPIGKVNFHLPEKWGWVQFNR